MIPSRALVRLGVLAGLLAGPQQQNPDVRRVLVATGDLALKPNHYEEPNAHAAWHYYEILTMIRREIR